MGQFMQARLCDNVYIAAYALLFLRHALFVDATTTVGAVTIGNTPGYLGQRECVQSALWSGRDNAGQSNIITWLGCTNILDSCFCREDLASSASSLLTSGINSFCSTNTVDVAGGISVYNSYCSAKGAMGYVTATTTTSSSDSSTATVTTTQTVFTSTASTFSPISTREFLAVLMCAFVVFQLALAPFMS